MHTHAADCVALLAATLLCLGVGAHAQEDSQAYMKREHSLVKPYHGES